MVDPISRQKLSLTTFCHCFQTPLHSNLKMHNKYWRWFIHLRFQAFDKISCHFMPFLRILGYLTTFLGVTYVTDRSKIYLPGKLSHTIFNAFDNISCHFMSIKRTLDILQLFVGVCDVTNVSKNLESYNSDVLIRFFVQINLFNTWNYNTSRNNM